MASSQYQHALNKRRRLVGLLVEHYVDTQPGEENYDLAMDFCLGNLAYHSFRDTYPPEVDEYLAGLQQRMVQESQLAKAAALDALCGQLHARLHGHGELSYVLLQLLASCAGRPVQAPFTQTPELLQLLYQPAAAAAGSPQRRKGGWKQQQQGRGRRTGAGPGSDAHTDGSRTLSDTSEDEYDPYEDSSELSDWEEGPQAGDSTTAAAAAAAATAAASGPAVSTSSQQAVGNQQADVDPTSSSSRGEPMSLSARVLGHGARGPHYVPAPGLLPTAVAARPCDLLSRLSAVRTRHAPHLSPDPAYCFPERFFVQQALLVLQGKPTAGFEWDAASRQFQVDPRCHTPQLSLGALRTMLGEVAAAGSCARRLQQLADHLAGAPLFEDSSDSCQQATAAPRRSCVATSLELPTTPCLRAFATALQQQLLLIGSQLSELRAQLMQRNASGDSSSDGGASTAPETLVQLLRVTQGVRARLTTLSQVLPPLIEDLSPCPAAASTHLLDGLVELLGRGCSFSGPSGLGLQASLLYLLLSSMVPLVDGLQRWLVGGREQEHLSLNSTAEAAACCGADFFIVQQGAVSVYDARFWSQAYAFATAPAVVAAAADGSAATEVRLPTCPGFLAPLARDIMTAGKSLRLLRHMEQEERLTSCSASSSRGGRLTGVTALAGLAKPHVYAPLYGTLSSAGGSGHRSSSLVVAGGAARCSSTGAAAGSRGGSRRGSTTGPAATTAPAAAAAEVAGVQPRRQRWEVADAGSSDLAVAGKALTQGLQLALALATSAAGRPAADSQQLQRVFVSTVVQLLQQEGCMAGLEAADGCSSGGAAAEQVGEQQARPLFLEVKQQLLEQMVTAGVADAQPCSCLPPAQEGALLGPCEVEDQDWLLQLLRDDGSSDDEKPTPLPPPGPTQEELAAAEAAVEVNSSQAQPGSMVSGLVQLQGQLLLPPDPLQEQRHQQLQAASTGWGYLEQLGGMLGVKLQPHLHLEWLLHHAPAQWVPVQPLLQQALLHPVKQQVSFISSALLSSLLGEWGLREQLAALRNLYCLTSPTVVAWADLLLDRVAVAARAGGLLAVDLSEMEAVLGDMIQGAAGWEDLPDPALLSLSLQLGAGGGSTGAGSRAEGVLAAAAAGMSRAEAQAAAASAAVADLAGLQVHHGGSWLLSLVLDQEQLQQFNKALGFLLQLRATRRQLDATRLRSCKGPLSPEEVAEQDATEVAAAGTAPSHMRGSAGRLGPGAVSKWLSPAQEQLLLLEMAQLMARLQDYVGHQLMTGAWARLAQALSASSTLDDVCAAVHTWLAGVLRQCCCGSSRGPGATWRHIGKQLQQLMGAAAAYATLHEQLQRARLDMWRGQPSSSDASSMASSRHTTTLTSATGSACAISSSMAALLDLRAALARQAGVWWDGAGYLMRLLHNKALQLGGGDDVEGLLVALDLNGYYSRQV